MTWHVTAGSRELSFFTVMSTLGTPLDITLAELAIEMFFPADAATEESLRSRRPVATRSDALLSKPDEHQGVVGDHLQCE